MSCSLAAASYIFGFPCLGTVSRGLRKWLACTPQVCVSALPQHQDYPALLSMCACASEMRLVNFHFFVSICMCVCVCFCLTVSVCTYICMQVPMEAWKGPPIPGVAGSWELSSSSLKEQKALKHWAISPASQLHLKNKNKQKQKKKKKQLSRWYYTLPLAILSNRHMHSPANNLSLSFYSFMIPTGKT